MHDLPALVEILFSQYTMLSMMADAAVSRREGRRSRRRYRLSEKRTVTIEEFA
jgi:hypothetical protein